MPWRPLWPSEQLFCCCLCLGGQWGPPFQHWGTHRPFQTHNNLLCRSILARDKLSWSVSTRPGKSRPVPPAPEVLPIVVGGAGGGGASVHCCGWHRWFRRPLSSLSSSDWVLRQLPDPLLRVEPDALGTGGEGGSSARAAQGLARAFSIELLVSKVHLQCHHCWSPEKHPRDLCSKGGHWARGPGPLLKLRAEVPSLKASCYSLPAAGPGSSGLPPFRQASLLEEGAGLSLWLVPASLHRPPQTRAKLFSIFVV